MTARIIAIPSMSDLWDDVRAALDEFDQAADELCGVPVRVVNALQSPDAVTVPITVCGVPVTLAAGPGSVARADLQNVWAAMCAAAPAAGSRIHTAGGRVLVCPPDTIGGAA